MLEGATVPWRCRRRVDSIGTPRTPSPGFIIPVPKEDTVVSTGSKIIGPASALALVCFFMPWVMVSCQLLRRPVLRLAMDPDLGRG